MDTMMMPVNYLAVLVAAVVSMVLGYFWYGPLFGKQWMEMSGMAAEKPGQEQISGMTSSYVIMFIGSLVMAWVLANAIIFSSAYTKMNGIGGGLMSGFFNWLGFISPVTLGTVLWEKKSWGLWFLNNGYYLISLLMMGSISAVWK